MSVFGYVRVSTDKQGSDGLGAQAQSDAIRARYADARLVVEVASGAKDRPELERLLVGLTAQDTLVLSKLDRLGRSTIDVIGKLNDLTDRGVTVVVLDLGLDTSTPAGRFAATVLAAAAELERNLISQRTKDALAAAKRRGSLPGRSVDPNVVQRVRDLSADGVSVHDISEVTGLSRATIYRYLSTSETGDL